MYFSSQILRHSSGEFDDIMLTDVYIFLKHFCLHLHM